MGVILTQKLAASLEEMVNEAKNILANSMATRERARNRATTAMRKRYNNYEYNRLLKLKKQVNEFSGNEKEFGKIFKKVKAYRPRSLSLKKNLVGIGLGAIFGNAIKSKQPETKGF